MLCKEVFRAQFSVCYRFGFFSQFSSHLLPRRRIMWGQGIAWQDQLESTKIAHAGGRLLVKNRWRGYPRGLAGFCLVLLPVSGDEGDVCCFACCLAALSSEPAHVTQGHQDHLLPTRCCHSHSCVLDSKIPVSCGFPALQVWLILFLCIKR